MTNTSACTTCGRPLEADGLHGLCASCMLKLVMEDGADQGSAGASPYRLLNIPGHKVLGELARGGMGIVYRAQQLEPARIVALKMLLPHRVTSPGMVERFRLEARAIAALEHPAILPVHHVGEHNGLPFFTMKFASGGTLAHRRQRFAGNWRAIAELTATLAEAVQFAHERGVLHRDLKPANVLFDESDRVYVSDFGLAKVAGVDSDLTRSCDLLGTPHYLAPEVAAGSAKDATIGSDVYSLGAILYELLAGRPPFEAAGIPALLKKIAEEEPARLSVPHDLEVICLKCLAKEPTRRYGTARELADDLRRWMEGRTILARPATRLERLRSWARRNPALASSFAALGLIFALGFAGVITQWRRAEQSSRELRQNLYVADMKLAHLALEHGNLGRAAELVTAHLPKPGEEDLRGFEWRFLWQLCQGDEMATLRGHEHAVSCIAFAPDGRKLATGSYDKTVKIWDTSTYQNVKTLSGLDTLRFGGLAFSPDGKWLAVKEHSAVLLFDTVDWQERHRLSSLPSHPLVDCVAFSTDGRTLAAGSSQGVQLWEASTWARKPTSSNSYDARLIAFGSDNPVLATTDGTHVTFFDSSRMTHLQSHHQELWSLALSSGEDVVVAGSSDGYIQAWDVQSREVVNAWKAHALFSFAVAFSPDGRILASGGGDQIIRLWDAATLLRRGNETDFDQRGPREIATLRGHSDQVWCVAYAPDGHTLASGSQDGTAKLWRAEEKPLARSHSNLVGQLCFSSDGQAMATVHEGLRLSEFDVVSMQETNSTALPFDAATVVSYTISLDNTRLAFLLRDSSCQIWDAWRRTPLATNQLDSGPYGKIALSRDNKTLAVESRGGDIVEVWDLVTNKKRFVCKDAGPPMILAENGRWLATPASGFTIKLWDTFTGRELATFAGHKRWIGALAVSPDERLLASGSTDSTARLWDLRSGREIGVLKGHLAGVEAVAFSADGRTLATGGYDASLRLWSVATHKEMLVLRDSNPAVGPVQFSPDGNTLAAAVAAADAEIRKPQWRLWRVPSLEQIEGIEQQKVLTSRSN